MPQTHPLGLGQRHVSGTLPAPGSHAGVVGPQPVYRTPMVAPQGGGRQPQRPPGQIPEASRGVGGIAVVRRPAPEQRIDAHAEGRRWDLRVPAEPLHPLLAIAFGFRGQAPPCPPGPLRVAWAPQILPPKAPTLTPGGHPGLLRVVPQAQLVLEPGGQGLFEPTRLGCALAAHDHQGGVRNAAATARVSGRGARHVVACCLGSGDCPP